MKVIEFRIEKSKQNTTRHILIAKTEDDREYVCSGDHWSPTYLIPIENSFDLTEKQNEKTI